MKKHIKIILSVVISCALLLVISIPSFANEDTYLIKAGTYVFNTNLDLISYPDDINLSIDIPFTVSPDYSIVNNSVVLGNGNVKFSNITVNRTNSLASSYLQYSSATDSSLVYSQAYYELPGGGWSAVIVSLFDSYPELNEDSVEPLIGWGRTITVTNDTFVSSDAGEWLNSHWTRVDDDVDYNGNAFLDIINMIIEALEVPIFGSFSLWDMLTTICGLFAVVWLLKLLAGG